MQLSSRRQLALAQASQAKRCSRNVEHNCPILTDTQFSYSRKTLMIDFGTSTPFFFDVRWNGMDQNRGFCWKKNPKEKQTPWGTELRCCGCYVRLVMDTWIHTWVLEVKSISRKISWKWFHGKNGFFHFLFSDSDPDTCSFTPRSSEQRWWQVHLGDALNVQAVAISITPGAFQKFTIFIIGISILKFCW